MKKILPALLCFLVLLAPGRCARADLAAAETGLNPTGAAYEVNPDSEGVLWISDYTAGQVWGVDPESGAFAVYAVGGAPSDARHDGQHLWWADGEGDILGQAATPGGAYTRWQAQGAAGFYGTALDGQGRFWAAGASSPYLLYRLEPGSARLCAFALPDGGAAIYLLYADGGLWLGDQVNARLLRLNVSDNTLDWWSLPSGSTPWDLAVDGQGHIWYTDTAHNQVSMLDLDGPALLRYALPLPAGLGMLTVRGSQVWFTEQMHGSLGLLDPLQAAMVSNTPSHESTSLQPSCEEDIPYSTGNLLVTTGQADWEDAAYPTYQDGEGWRRYNLPDQSLPWGIASAGAIWFVDNGRQVLGRILSGVQVSACKLKDLDGDSSTTADQTPLEGWLMYLNVGGIRQLPGQVTGADGCTTWGNLAAGVVYGLEEARLPGWLALGPTSRDFELAKDGDQFIHSFVNFEAQAMFLPQVSR